MNCKILGAEGFSKQNIIFLYNLFNIKNEFKTWDKMKVSYILCSKSHFKYKQIVKSIPKTWKKVSKES